jgi:hypothetical protein
MKHKLLYLSGLLLLITSACIKTQNVTPTPAPAGTFTGVFGYLHRANDKVPFDTLKANITLTLTSSNGTFQVAGDTSTLHAGSYGTYALNSEYIGFVDASYPKTGTPVKKHLNGTYLYAFNGTVLQMLVNIGDTVSMQYELTKN